MLVVAVNHDGVEMLTHQFLNRGKGFGAGNDGKVQLAENLCYGASRFFIGTEEESLITHIKVIVGTPVRLIKLR